LILDQDPIAPSEPIFKQLGWMSIEQRIKYKYLLVSKCLKNEAPVYLKKIISNTHSNNQLKTKCNLNKKVALIQDLNIS
jgi:hypothetical protein